MDTFVAHLQPTVAEGQALLQRLLGPDSDGKGGNLTPLGQSAGGTKTLRDARERAAGKMPETRVEDDDDEDGVEVELLGLTSPLKRARPMSSASRGAETESDEFGAVKSGGARDTHLAALNPLHLAPRGALEVLHKYVPAALLPDLLVALSLEEDAPVSVRAVKTKSGTGGSGGMGKSNVRHKLCAARLSSPHYLLTNTSDQAIFRDTNIFRVSSKFASGNRLSCSRFLGTMVFGVVHRERRLSWEPPAARDGPEG